LVCQVELICIGNELLIGKTLNTNAHWLSKRVTSLGCIVRRTTVVRDEISEIAASTREAIARKPDFIITTGGLGPTFDDMTLEGVARALSRKLEMNDEALEMLRERYAEFTKMGRIKDHNLTEYRLKMARLPQGARPIHNPVGTAPGVMIHENSTTIFVLPGVPQEMEAIFEASIIHLLRDKSDGLFYVERSLQVLGVVESSLAALIDQVMLEYPAIYIKSHPIGSEPEVHIELHLTTSSRNKEGAEEEIREAMEKIQVLISQKGGRTGFV